MKVKQNEYSVLKCLFQLIGLLYVGVGVEHSGKDGLAVAIHDLSTFINPVGRLLIQPMNVAISYFESSVGNDPIAIK